jgi:hypothetical protein
MHAAPAWKLELLALPAIVILTSQATRSMRPAGLLLYSEGCFDRDSISMQTGPTQIEVVAKLRSCFPKGTVVAPPVLLACNPKGPS